MLIRVRPGRAKLYVARAACEMSKQTVRDLDAIYGDADRAIQLDPELVRAWLIRSAVRCQRGEFEGAIEDTTAALQIDPEQAYAFHLRALCRAFLGDFVNAYADMEEATRIAPGHEYAAKIRRTILALKDSALRGEEKEEWQRRLNAGALLP
jgi:tetratricopeptide (TPR) repeat protein